MTGRAFSPFHRLFGKLQVEVIQECKIAVVNVREHSFDSCRVISMRTQIAIGEHVQPRFAVGDEAGLERLPDGDYSQLEGRYSA